MWTKICPHFVHKSKNQTQNKSIIRDWERLFLRYSPARQRAFGAGNNPRVGMTVAVAVAIEEASK